MLPSIRLAGHVTNGLRQRHIHTTYQMNFKFKLTDELTKEFEEKKRQEEAKKKKSEPSKPVLENLILLGKVSQERYKNVVRVAIPKHRLNQQLLMYIRDADDIQALDEDGISSPGDWVLLRRDPEIVDPKVRHRIERIVHAYGKFVDPISGRRSFGIYFDDDMERLEKIKLDI